MNQPPHTAQSKPEQAPIDSTDAAWVTIKTPLSPDALMGFSKDIEALVRVNPYYVFKSWRESTDDLQVDFILDTLEKDLRERGRLEGARPENRDFAMMLVDEYIHFPPPQSG